MLTVNGAGNAFAMIASFGDGWYRVMGWNRDHEVPDDAPLDLDEVKEIARRALGTDYGMHDAAGCPGSTATSVRCRGTGSAGSCSPATPRTSTHRPAARA